MKAKQLGNTRVLVPELALGTWQYRGGVDPLLAGIEFGTTFIDTAESYGSEPVVGRAIRGIRDRIFLASKVSPRHFRRHDVIKAAECSLKQLNTHYLDLYQLHWPNYTVPISETMTAMERLVETGKVRFIGVSNFTVAELRRAQSVLSNTRIVSNQVRYSLVDRLPEEGLLQYCDANQISLLAYSPLATGFETIRNCDPDDVLGQVAADVGKTRAQVALSWCVSHSAVIAIFKADKPEHVRENCAASGWELSPEHRQILEKRIRHHERSRAERFLRGLARRTLQYAGRNLGSATAMDDHSNNDDSSNNNDNNQDHSR
ncbi:MAG: aldo/keto reductase [Terriglobales bacterium]|jgi:diketogulonate reductase-like aldo/keto reductase